MPNLYPVTNLGGNIENFIILKFLFSQLEMANTLPNEMQYPYTVHVCWNDKRSWNDRGARSLSQWQFSLNAIKHIT